MATLQTLRAQLQVRLQTISGLRTYDTWPDILTVPGASIRAIGRQVRTTFASNGFSAFKITMAVQGANLNRVQDALDPYMDFTGSSSIIAALEGDGTLSSNAQYLDIGEWSDPELRAVNSTGGEIPYWMADLAVDVHHTF